MPALPSAQDLGGLPVGGGPRPVASADTSAIGRGIGSFGTGLSTLGNDLQYMGQQAQQKQNTIETAKADAAYLIGKQNLDQARGDAVYGDDLNDHAPKYQVNLDTAAQGISDPAKRAEWVQGKLSDVNASQIATKAHADKLTQNEDIADAYGDLSSLRDSAIKSNDPAFKEQAIKGGKGIIQGMVDEGWITPEKGREVADGWTQNYAVDSLKMMPPQQRLAALGASATNLSGTAIDRTMQILRDREGFISTPRWDENHLRVGYGSDTITLPDGSHKEVQQGDAVTQADAERDLARRTNIFLNSARVAIGADKFDKLSPNAQAAIGSVTYNYGHTPERVISAAQSGDSGAVADAIERLQGDNGGVNKTRRIMEASIARTAADGTSSAPGALLANIIPPDQRQGMITDTMRQIDASNRQEVASVKSLWGDDQASIIATGRPLDSLSPDRVRAAMGDQAAQDFQRERGLATTYHNAVKDWDTLPSEQIMARAESLAPTPGQAGFSDAQKYYEAAQKAAQDTITKRSNDPAGAVEKAPDVVAAKQGVNPSDPSSYAPVIKARLTAQSALGIPESAQSPITDDEAKQYATALRPVAKGQADAANQDAAINQVVQDVNSKFGPYAQQAMSRILYHVTLKRDAADVLAAAMQRYHAEMGPPAPTPDEARQIQMSRDADRAAKIAGPEAAMPGDEARGWANMGMTTPPEPAKPTLVPTPDHIKLLLSNPALGPKFDQVYGAGAAQGVLSVFGAQPDKGEKPAK